MKAKGILVAILAVLTVAVCALAAILLIDANTSAPDVVFESPQTPLPEATPEPTPEPTPDPTPEPTPEPTPTPLSEEAALALVVENMSVEEKVGQLAMFGFYSSSEIPEDFAAIMEKYRIGSVMLYGWNVDRESSSGFEQTAALLQKLTAANKSDIPLLTGIDVEGGEVVRFVWEPKTKSAQTLGASGDTQACRDQFARIGQALMDIGINMDFAPVLDVAPIPEETFVGETGRIFSSDAGVVSEMGAAAIEGLASTGCLSVGKHFPGHGGSAEDSHEVTPVVDKSLSELWSYDLLPFKAAVDAGADAMLVAHILYPQVDSEIASLSPVFIDGILREQMGFSGLVISDDFRMGGLSSRYSLASAAVKFVNAGGDLILCGRYTEKQTEIMDALLAAAQDGRISEERLNESVTRVLRKKLAATDWDIIAYAESFAGAE